MREIKLSQGRVVIVDDVDYYWLNCGKWSAKKSKNTCYAVKIKKINGHKERIFMHRLIMNTPTDMEVDHKDGDGLNCQRNNMRNCTHRENGINRKKCWGRSKYKGVSYNGKYIRAVIKYEGRQLGLGNFKTEEAAAIAYNKAAIKIFGEFANLNIIKNE